MTQRMEPGPQRQSQDSQRTIFQGAELCSIQVADDMCPADFTIAMVPLCAFCITLHPLHLNKLKCLLQSYPWLTAVGQLSYLLW